MNNMKELLDNTETKEEYDGLYKMIRMALALRQQYWLRKSFESEKK